MEKKSQSLLGATDTFDTAKSKSIMSHPLPHWVEQMTINYLVSNGGNVERRNNLYDITWPDGFTLEDVVFTSEESEKRPESIQLTLENQRVRKLIDNFSDWKNRTSIPFLRIPQIPNGISGYWSLWQIGIGKSRIKDKRIMPCFIHSDGRTLQPTAMKIWDILLVEDDIKLDGEEKWSIDNSDVIIQNMTKPLFEELVSANNHFINKEKAKGDYSFAARRRAINNIGLPEVRNYRLKRINEEYEHWKADIDNKSTVMPELKLLLALQIKDIN